MTSEDLPEWLPKLGVVRRIRIPRAATPTASPTATGERE